MLYFETSVVKVMVAKCDGELDSSFLGRFATNV